MAKVQPFLFTVTSSANGDYTEVRLVFKGVQNSQSRISSIATDGPRISRAQVFDALSSMANISGYRAVIEASNHFAFGRSV